MQSQIVRKFKVYSKMVVDCLSNWQSKKTYFTLQLSVELSISIFVDRWKWSNKPLVFVAAGGALMVDTGALNVEVPGLEAVGLAPVVDDRFSIDWDITDAPGSNKAFVISSS